MSLRSEKLIARLLTAARLTARKLGEIGGIDVTQLFADGQDGVWFEPEA